MIKIKILKESRFLAEAAPTKDEAIATLTSNKFNRTLHRRIATDQSQEGSADPEVVSGLLKTIIERIPFAIGDELADKDAGVSIMWIKNNLIEDTPEGRSFREIFIKNPKYVMLLKVSLIKYYEVKNSVPSFVPEEYRDIMKIKTVDSLHDITEIAKKNKLEYEYNKLTTDIIDVGEFNGYSIKIANNKRAACELGKDTEWCTSKKDLPFYESYYKKESPIFIVRGLANPDELYQIGFLQNQFQKPKNINMTNEEFAAVLLAFKQSGIGDKYPEITKTQQWITGKVKQENQQQQVSAIRRSFGRFLSKKS